MKKRTKKAVDMAKTMAGIGCIGFGGGSALIPIIQREAVEEKKLVSRKELDKSIIVASITPGALPVEIAAGLGYHTTGNLGMLLSAIGMALPGSVFTMILLMILSVISGEVFTQIQYMSVGVSLFIVYLLCHYTHAVVDASKIPIRKLQKIVIILAVFVLNGGKELYTFLGIDRPIYFDISSIQIMGLAFFLVLFLTDHVKWYNVLIATILSGLFVCCYGKGQMIANEHVKMVVTLLMVILAGYGLYQTVHGKTIATKSDLKDMRKTFLVWLLMSVVLLLPACIVLRTIPWEFIGRGVMASALSFGGGDAFLSVAEGAFVDTGMITAELFYEQVVMVVNILPGSILCKTLTGIGYVLGYQLTGSVIGGLLVGIAGFGLSMFGACSIFMAAYQLYTNLEQFTMIQMIGKVIKPIVSGLLISIALSLITNILKMSATIGVPIGGMGLFCAVIFGLIYYMSRKKQKFIVIILTAITSALLFCNLM